ncbi:ubiquitin-conjugating enzyme E2-binding protein [Coniella lustricola]|uniref:Ubiquitin-conjugating enzyme E2-binding protein n=1 Tax=Coniella lustricola TaxID=2025994 RepID=A0A2T3ADN0_9PEZI|nr:ubiquitin-conjugating enzyme E2-binding protein [Coniella lustricola]
MTTSSIERRALPSLYAEFLPKLGRISIVVHLPSQSTWTTKALISNDGERLIVYHERISTEIILPTAAKLRGEHLPGEIPPGLFKMSWRLLAQDSLLTGGLASQPALIPEVAPWSALVLRPRTDVLCRKCETVVVSRESLKEWKDLPSENWAEMMEFWHCHKPVINNDQRNRADSSDNANDLKASESALASRGYGANTAIFAQAGIGFVDLTRMLFHKEDCRCNVMFMNNADIDPNLTLLNTQTHRSISTVASCPGCNAQLGVYDTRKDGVSIFKWMLKFADSPANSLSMLRPPTLSHCLATALFATQERTGSAKVVLQGDKEAITAWILNPRISFSCNSKQKVSAMKLLWQNRGREEEEELILPDSIVKDIRGLLQEGNSYLPPDEKMKQFNAQDGVWTVALLERPEQ